ncbi:MAG: flavocytochrome c [Deltaproteobacteria bacterium]|nr:MAG: flavocytochrome c [Deltaproteobacteria bacterium]
MTRVTTVKRWDRQTDVVVVGSGLAGLAAAIEARIAGSDVLVLEKMKGYGGNSAISDGVMAAAGTALQRRAGIVDSADRMAEDMRRAGLGLNQADLVHTVAQRSVEAFRWTIDFLGMTYQKRVDQFGGHSVPRCYTPLRRSGSQYIRPMLDKAAQLGVAIRNRTCLETIVRDTDGRVCGVAVRQGRSTSDAGPGERVWIRARRAVVLATGGFANDIAFRTAQDPRLSAAVGSTNKTCTTAEALREAMRIGAMPVHLSWIQLGPWACPDEKMYGVGPDFASYVAFPYGILVNPDTGRRIVNELADRKTRADAILAVGHPCISMTDQNGVVHSGHEIGHCLRRGVVQSFESLEALAAYYDMPRDAFLDTVRAFNQGAAKREDGLFGKPILAGAGPLETPPFYAMRTFPKVHHTMGGVLIDTRARVLDLQRAPIEGLYAAGEVAGGIHGACRLGSCAITDCLVFGRIAGQNAGRTVLPR